MILHSNGLALARRIDDFLLVLNDSHMLDSALAVPVCAPED